MRHVIAVACPMSGPTFHVRRPLCAKLRNKGEIRAAARELRIRWKAGANYRTGVMAGVHEASYRRQFVRARAAGRGKSRALRNYPSGRRLHLDRRFIRTLPLVTRQCLIDFRKLCNISLIFLSFFLIRSYWIVGIIERSLADLFVENFITTLDILITKSSNVEFQKDEFFFPSFSFGLIELLE